jgi:hypothetical protein
VEREKKIEWREQENPFSSLLLPSRLAMFRQRLITVVSKPSMYRFPLANLRRFKSSDSGGKVKFLMFCYSTGINEYFLILIQQQKTQEYRILIV